MAASGIFTSLSGGDLLAILDKIVSFNSNEMCRERRRLLAGSTRKA